MTCEQCSENLMDVLYSEELPPRRVFEFFQHLSICPACEREYHELIGTREMLAAWSLESEMPEVDAAAVPAAYPDRSRSGFRYGVMLQRVAAGIVMVLGVMALLQWSGLIPARSAELSREEMAEMIHDLVIARQVEDWKVIGAALLNLKEELEAQDRMQLDAVYGDILSLEERYVRALEENNRQLKAAMSQ